MISINQRIPLCPIGIAWKTSPSNYLRQISGKLNVQLISDGVIAQSDNGRSKPSKKGFQIAYVPRRDLQVGKFSSVTKEGWKDWRFR